jgi:predicted nucleotidyltransferase
MNIIRQNIQEINTLCASHRVKSLFAFGSISTGDFKKESDIDLIVEFSPMGTSDYANNYFDLKFSLEKILQHPIDLLESKSIRNPFFKKNIESQMRQIYGNKD